MYCAETSAILQYIQVTRIRQIPGEVWLVSFVWRSPVIRRSLFSAFQALMWTGKYILDSNRPASGSKITLFHESTRWKPVTVHNPVFSPDTSPFAIQPRHFN